MSEHQISTAHLSLEEIGRILESKADLCLSDDSVRRIRRCRQYLDKKISRQNEPIYGVTTGFGSLCNHSISHADLCRLQKNLVMSHACGMGEEVPQNIVKLMLLLKIQSLAYGHSGIRLETIERLIDFYNEDMLPLVYNQGSLGASGDLAPLAHLSLPLLGLGEVNYKGKRMPSGQALKQKGWQPVELDSKEGLALLNGTQFMGAYGIYCLLQAERLFRWSDLIAAMSLEAYDGRSEPFLEQVHQLRHHAGQLETARRFRDILRDSRLISKHKNHVQDPYSFRCIPQVHGASKDAVLHVKQIFENEANAVTDNPTLFPDDDLIISAGNFHGQPLAMGLDYLGIAMAELGNIAERRVYRLISGSRELPSFLVAKPGLNSGFMIPQYTAASVVSQNKQLCTPASVDSIESSQGQEDHVSMGANAAVKTLQITKNLEKLLAIELMTAAQALKFRGAENTSAVLFKLYTDFSAVVPFVEIDKVMYTEMEKARSFLHENDPCSYLP